MQLKPIISATEAAQKVQSGDSTMIGGFMTVGSPLKVIDALVELGTGELSIIGNDTGLVDKGIGRLIANRQAKQVIASHIGLNPETGRQMNAGELEVDLIPQGTLIERIRCAGAGIGGFLTRTGLGTIVEENKEKIVVDDQEFLLEHPLTADIALIKASVVDKAGNCIFYKTTKNFNPVMAMAAQQVIVEAERVVEVGEVDADRYTLPGTFIDFIAAD